MSLAVVALAAFSISPALSAPARYRYRNLLLVEFKGRAFLTSGIPILDSGALDVIQARASPGDWEEKPEGARTGQNIPSQEPSGLRDQASPDPTFAPDRAPAPTGPPKRTDSVSSDETITPPTPKAHRKPLPKIEEKPPLNLGARDSPSRLSVHSGRH